MHLSSLDLPPPPYKILCMPSNAQFCFKSHTKCETSPLESFKYFPIQPDQMLFNGIAENNYVIKVNKTQDSI